MASYILWSERKITPPKSLLTNAIGLVLLEDVIRTDSLTNYISLIYLVDLSITTNE